MGAEASKWMSDVGVGRMLGRYELLVPIAQGGMAVVWAARMKSVRGFQKIVALKSMLPSLSEDPQFEAMFLAEARLASRIKHPNVCEILDLGEDDGVLYIVMEWVDGESLSALQKAARTKHKPFPPGISARLIRSAALGLHAAHELTGDSGAHIGLVHRDVSPQNILVGHDGTVKIVDFGVAKATVEGAAVTQTGQIKGKVPFMAPEQLVGKPLDRRADIFALGICLYQLVTGKHPFRADSDIETMGSIVGPDPVEPPSKTVPGVPPALDAVILRALEKDRDARFATMADMARALDAVLPALGGSEADVADFVKEMIGDRGEKRRADIKDAQRLADLRTELLKAGTNPENGLTAATMLTIPIESKLSPPAADPPPIDGPGTSPGSSMPTVLAVHSSTAPPPRRWWVGAVAIAAGASLLVTTAVFLLSHGQARSPAASAVSDPQAAPVISVAPGADTAPVATVPAAPPADTTAPTASASAAPEAPSASAVPSATPKSKAPPVRPGGKATAVPANTPRFVNPDF